MIERPSHTWMRGALAFLFEVCEDADLRHAIRDPASLAALRQRVSDSLTLPDRVAIPSGDKGDNLLLALISLRLKFDRQEAERKLERNLKLRHET
jgi:hypothetical protein